MNNNNNGAYQYLFVGDSNGKTLQENAFVYAQKRLRQLNAHIIQLEKDREEFEAVSAQLMKELLFWRKANSNPEYKLCRDRLMYEFNELIS